MALPELNTGTVVTSTPWNDHVNQVNENTNTLLAHGDQIATIEGDFADLQQEQIGAFEGQWSSSGSNLAVSGGSGTKLTCINTANKTPSGCAFTNGTLTVQEAGLWWFQVSVQLEGTTSKAATWFSRTNIQAPGNGIAKYGATASSGADASTASLFMRMGAGDVISPYVACWTLNSSVTVMANASTNITAIRFSA